MLQKILSLTLLCASFGRISSAPGGPVIVDFTQDKTNFRGKIHVNGVSHHLNLERPATSVLSPNFRSMETIVGPDGKILVRDILTKSTLPQLEENIYVDEEANAVFTVENVDGEIRLHGVVADTHISHDGTKHFAVVQDHVLRNHESDYNDYIDSGITLTADPSVDSGAPVTANPELYITVDYDLYQTLLKRPYASSNDAINGYLVMMIRLVNNRYKTVSDPSIRMKIVGINTIKDPNAQPFISENVVGGKLKTTEGLNAFSKFMTTYKFPDHDLAPLLTGLELTRAMGIARLNGACGEDDSSGSSKVSLTIDVGGAWSYTRILAHELGHNMGAAHDGETAEGYPPFYPSIDASDCPWNGTGSGYIMSYIIDPVLSFTFSKCSQKSLKNFITSLQGKCLREDNPSRWVQEAPFDAGKYLSMEEQCIAIHGSSSKVGRAAAEQCDMLHCTNSNGDVVSAGAPLDGTACGAKRRCQEGKCVASAD